MDNYGYETDSRDELSLSVTDSDHEIELFSQTNTEINPIDPYR